MVSFHRKKKKERDHDYNVYKRIHGINTWNNVRWDANVLPPVHCYGYLCGNIMEYKTIYYQEFEAQVAIEAIC